MKSIEKYALAIGKFWVNFNSLELALRVYLTKKNLEPEVGLELAVGAKCPLSHLTNYDSFETLAEEYNATVARAHRRDFSKVAKLRNALAHGRVTTKTQVPMTVVKFSKPHPRKRTVTVEFKETLSPEYLNECTRDMNRMILDLVALINKEFPRRN